MVLRPIKKLISRNFHEVELGDQKGELLCPAMKQSPIGRRKTPLLSWQGLRQWKTMGSLFTTAPRLPLSLCKTLSFPYHLGDLHVTCHGCWTETAVLCWSWMHPSLLENYLEIYFRSMTLSMGIYFPTGFLFSSSSSSTLQPECSPSKIHLLLKLRLLKRPFSSFPLPR